MSLRTRLLAVVALAAVLALGLATTLTYLSLRDVLAQQLSRTLRADSSAVAATVAAAGVPSPATVRAEAPGAFVQLRSADGEVLETVSAVTAGGQRLDCQLPAQLPLEPSGKTTTFQAAAASPGTTGFQVVDTALPGGGLLLVALPSSGIDATLRRLLGTDIAFGGAALAVALLVGWLLVRRSMRPLHAIQRTAALIADGDVEQRVPAQEGSSEVGQVARSLNFMLDRIQWYFSQRAAIEADLRRSEARLRRFVADASHELRTPVTAVSAYAQLLERAAPGDAAVRDRAVSGINRETARMGLLVDELLLLARLDQGRPLDRTPVDLVGVVADAANAARAVGLDHPVELEASEPLVVLGDPLRLRQVLDNLVGNVRAHTPAGTRTRIRLGRREQWAVVEVADDGPGIPADDLPHVFERFYRADRSRSHHAGTGSGLGLTIVEAIVAAHGGTTRAGTGDPGGAVITVWLPLQEPAGEDGRPGAAGTP